VAAKLYIGTRRYSSWSLRGWLMVRLAGLQAEEVIIPLQGGDTPGVKAVSPNGMVPYLEHDGARIWESLASHCRGNTCWLPRLADCDADESRTGRL
jgi:glutathione S-transferase